MRAIGFTALALSMLGAPVMAGDPPRPITLECVEATDSVEFKVVGQADPSAEASFRLEIVSNGRGGTTNTVQRGSSRVGGPGGTLLQSRITTVGLSGWTARLHVTGAAGDYTLTRSM